MLHMQEELQQRIDTLSNLLSEIRRNMEGLMAENQRLREVVRLAESELRNRRDQVQNLETTSKSIKDARAAAKEKVEQTIGKVDELIANISRAAS